MSCNSTPDHEDTGVKDHQQALREAVWKTYSTDFLVAQEQDILLPVKLHPLDRSIRGEEFMASSFTRPVSPELSALIDFVVEASGMKVYSESTDKNTQKEKMPDKNGNYKKHTETESNMSDLMPLNGVKTLSELAISDFPIPNTPGKQRYNSLKGENQSHNNHPLPVTDRIDTYNNRSNSSRELENLYNNVDPKLRFEGNRSNEGNYHDGTQKASISDTVNVGGYNLRNSARTRKKRTNGRLTYPELPQQNSCQYGEDNQMPHLGPTCQQSCAENINFNDSHVNTDSYFNKSITPKIENDHKQLMISLTNAPTNFTQNMVVSVSTPSQLPCNNTPSFFNKHFTQKNDPSLNNGIASYHDFNVARQSEQSGGPLSGLGTQPFHNNNLVMMNNLTNVHPYKDLPKSFDQGTGFSPQLQNNSSNNNLPPYRFPNPPCQSETVKPAPPINTQFQSFPRNNFVPPLNQLSHKHSAFITPVDFIGNQSSQIAQPPISSSVRQTLPLHTEEQHRKPPPPYCPDAQSNSFSESGFFMGGPRRRVRNQKVQSMGIPECLEGPITNFQETPLQAVTDPACQPHAQSMVRIPLGNSRGRGRSIGNPVSGKRVPVTRRTKKIPDVPKEVYDGLLRDRLNVKLQLEGFLCDVRDCNARVCSLVKEHLSHIQGCISISFMSCKICHRISNLVFHSAACQDLNCPNVYCNIVAKKSTEKLFADPGFVVSFLRSVGVPEQDMQGLQVLKTIDYPM